MNSEPLAESKLTNGNGKRTCTSLTVSVIQREALLRIDAFSVHPVTMSVMVRVRANSPMKVGPQCATVSASIAPDWSSRSSATVRILMEVRSRGDALVVEMPLRRVRSRAGRRYRSTVAALMAPSS